MARVPLLQLSDISLTFGGDPLLDGVDLVVQPGDRLALVGRNGSGKSTLMKLMAGLVEPDSGARALPPGVSVGYMQQHPDMSGFATLGDFAASDLHAPKNEESPSAPKQQHQNASEAHLASLSTLYTLRTFSATPIDALPGSCFW